MEPRLPSLDQSIHILRTLAARDISDLASQKNPEDKLPVAYLAGLNEKDRILCLRASICIKGLAIEVRKVIGESHTALSIGISATVSLISSTSNPSRVFNGVWGVDRAVISGSGERTD